jgi:multidrug efflux pump subunit AcrA (membrane-fusion protein)
MAASSEHTHHIKIRSKQLEIQPATGAHYEDDYDSKLRAAEDEINRIQQQRDALANQKRELEELAGRKRNLLSQQAELSEKLTSALTLIDRGLFEMNQEADDLQQCRVCFAAHLEKIQRLNPESWARDAATEKLEKALMTIDIASDEYDQAATHFQGTRSGTIFGGPTQRGRSVSKSLNSSEFLVNLRNGFAFNLPILALGAVALLIYLAK